MKKIISNSILSLMYYIINLFTNFWITTILISSLGKGVYSFYPLANNLTGWMIIISTAINSMLARHISVSLGKKDLKLTKELYSTAMIADVFIGMVLLIPIIIISMGANFFFRIPSECVADVKIMFFFVFLTVPIDMIMTVFSISWTAKDRLYLQYFTRIIQCVIKTIGILVPAYMGKISLVQVGLSILIADIVFFVCVIMIKRKIMSEIDFNTRYFNKDLLKKVIGSGLWNSLSQMGNSLLLQCDLIVSNIKLGPEASGTISIVTTIPNAITSIVTLLGSVFMPDYFQEYATSNSTKGIVEKVKKAQLLIGGFVGTIIILVLVYGVDFYELWVPGNDSVFLMKLSCFYLIPLVVSSLFRCVSDILVVLNRMKFQAIMSIINGVINIIMMFVLIKFTDFGIFSIVITTFTIIICWYGVVIPKYVSKLLECKSIEFYKSPCIVVAILLVELFILAFIRSQVGVLSSWIKFFTVGIGSCATCAIILFCVFKLVNCNKTKDKNLR